MAFLDVSNVVICTAMRASAPTSALLNQYIFAQSHIQHASEGSALEEPAGLRHSAWVAVEQNSVLAKLSSAGKPSFDEATCLLITDELA
jgi:hypothetical protein